MTDERTRALERRWALSQHPADAEAWLRALTRGGGDRAQILRARYALGLIRHEQILRLALLGYGPARSFLDWKSHLWLQSSFAWWITEVARTNAELAIALPIALRAWLRLCGEVPDAAARIEGLYRPALQVVEGQLREPREEVRLLGVELLDRLSRPREGTWVAFSAYSVFTTALHAVTSRQGFRGQAARAALLKAGELPPDLSGGALKRAGLGKGRLHWAVAAALLPRELGEPATPSIR